MEIKEFRGKYFFLSNFFEDKEGFTYDGIHYTNSECAFQSAKVKDLEKRERLFKGLRPSQSKRKGRNVQLRHNWDRIRDQIMFDVLYQKFSRPDMKKKLLATGEALLKEGNTWGDTYWGVCRGKGRNMLGKTLMQIRETLKKEDR